jgi:NAD(P)H-flavin reductase
MKKITAQITNVADLSKTAKMVTLALPESIDFIAGQFVNVFMNINGERVRRAFSVSSSDSGQSSLTLSIRRTLNGVMSPLLWQQDLIGSSIELMGPLGLNTADKMSAPNAYLFAYGVGGGVIKSVLDHILRKGLAKRIVVMTGSRSEDDIIHRDYFDAMAQKYPFIEVRHVVSQSGGAEGFRIGYIQDHIEGIDFNNADVYACGQEVACDSLVEKIRAQKPENCNFLIEAFH